MNFENINFVPPEEQESEKDKEKIENTISPEQSREDAYHWLQNCALDLNNVYIKSMDKTLSNQDIKSGTYNRVNGVVLFNIDGKIGALPDDEKIIDMITQSQLILDESVGVPQFNTLDAWGSESERNQSSAFKEWLEVNSKFNN